MGVAMVGLWTCVLQVVGVTEQYGCSDSLAKVGVASVVDG